jgi:adenine specific DNA methylase Mod
MPLLSWIGKDKVVNHDKELPFRVLKTVKELSVGEASKNLLIEGDNLEALKALMPFYYGKVKCIYIDPPYNTGNEGWVYNDKVNNPQIKSWINKVVGSEGEDLCRHDKWLCMMYPRLKLLHQLLSDTGFIFISIDEKEVHHLRILMDEIFGESNFLTFFLWKKKSTSTNVSGVSVSNQTEFILSYKKSAGTKLSPRVRSRDTRVYPYKDKDGNYRLTIILKVARKWP